MTYPGRQGKAGTQVRIWPESLHSTSQATQQARCVFAEVLGRFVMHANPMLGFGNEEKDILNPICQNAWSNHNREQKTAVGVPKLEPRETCTPQAFPSPEESLLLSR